MKLKSNSTNISHRLSQHKDKLARNQFNVTPAYDPLVKISSEIAKMPTSSAPKEEPEPFTIEHFPNETDNLTVPRLGRFAMPAASFLTLFYANPAFARIIANSQAGTAFEKDALGVGIVTYTATYWWDPSILISSIIKFTNAYFAQLEGALQT